MTVALDTMTWTISPPTKQFNCGGSVNSDDWSPSDESPLVWLADPTYIRGGNGTLDYWNCDSHSIGVAGSDVGAIEPHEAYRQIRANSHFLRANSTLGQYYRFTSSLDNSELALSSGLYPRPEVESTSFGNEEEPYRGVQPLNLKHKILFTEMVEIKTSELRRWKPSFSPYTDFSDDDE